CEHDRGRCSSHWPTDAGRVLRAPARLDVVGAFEPRAVGGRCRFGLARSRATEKSKCPVSKSAQRCLSPAAAHFFIRNRRAAPASRPHAQAIGAPHLVWTSTALRPSRSTLSNSLINNVLMC